MSPQPAQNPLLTCDCGAANDTDAGRTQCIDCRAPLPDPYGGDYLTTNPPKKKGK